MSISKTTLQKMAKQYAPQDEVVAIKVGDKDVDIKVKRALSMVEFGAAAKDMADMQFIVGVDGKEEYAPSLAEFAERYVIATYFADLDLKALIKNDGSTMSAAEPVWQFLWSEVYNEIYKVVCRDSMQAGESQYWALVEAANELVEARKKTLEPGAAKLWAALDELVDQMKQSFGDMAPEDADEFRAVVKKLSGLNEGKIIELMKE